MLVFLSYFLNDELSKLTHWPAIQDAPVKLNALAAENMRVSYNDLVKRMTLHYGEQVVYQIHKVLGSADVIGNPGKWYYKILCESK